MHGFDHKSAAGDQSRRSFLKWTGVAAASLACAAPSLAQAAPKDKAPKAKKAATVLRPVAKGVKLGVASYTFRKFDLDKAIAQTKRAGLTHFCIKSMHLAMDAKPADIKAAVQKITDAGLVAYGCGVVGMTNEAQITQGFEYAKAGGFKVIVIAPTSAMLPLINEKVKQYDVQVAIHNHGPGDKNFPTPESAYEQIKSLDRRMGLCIDIGHTIRIGANLVESIEKYADRLFDVHIKDVSEASPKGHCIQIGRGVIDIPAFLRTIVKVKYSGSLSYEYEIDDNDPLPGLCESVGYTKGVLAAL
jgi:sugar phosphate isomerase/epimerase